MATGGHFTGILIDFQLKFHSFLLASCQWPEAASTRKIYLYSVGYQVSHGTMITNIGNLPAVCINLDRRTDRWQRFSSQPACAKMIQSGQLKRWSAVDGKNIDWLNDKRVSLVAKRNIKEKWRRSHEDLNSVGGIGCALTHISIWKWLVDSDHDAVIVFEDDAKVPVDFYKRLQIAVDNSRILQSGDYDLIVPAATARLSEEPVERFVKKVDYFMCLQCYIITKECARKFLAKVFPITEHIDLWMCLYKFIYGLRLYCINPMWINVTQFGSKSDITPIDYCPLCNYDTEFYKKYRLVSRLDFWSMRVAELGLAGIAGWWLWKHYGRAK